MRYPQAILLGIALWAAPALAGAAQLQTIQSQTGQFVVRGLPQTPLRVPASMQTNLSCVRLDPSVLVVSCERVKQALLEELDLPDRWRDRVLIFLHPVAHDRQAILVKATRFREGWFYRLDMPELVDNARLLKVIVQVLLLEIANRRARDKTVELPPWLAEGLAAQLEATAGATLALEPYTGIVQAGRRSDPLRTVRETLRRRTPLTLDELSWPSDVMFSDQNLEVYRSCAHLFVHSLLRLRHGRECLQEMLLMQPEYLNWQTAFLGCFRSHFTRLIDVDKWWALSVVHLTGRDPFSVWPRDESWRQLDELLNTPVQVRVQTNDLPMFSAVKLQGVIAGWDDARQVALLTDKINRLLALRLRVAQDFAELVDQYRQVLESYLQRRSSRRLGPRSTEMTATHRNVSASAAIRRLDALDRLRESLRPVPATTAAAMESALVQSLRR
jgi:hypothetical protein